MIPGVSTAAFDVATASLGNVQYFLIPNGGNLQSAGALTGPIKVIQLPDNSFAIAKADAAGNVVTDSSGNAVLFAGSGARALFTEASKNPFDVDQASGALPPNGAALASDTADGPTGAIYWEDITASGFGGTPGDGDYNDVVFNVALETLGTTAFGTGPQLGLHIDDLSGF